MSNNSEPRRIMTSLHICDVIDGVKHFIPCMVVENEAGYKPMGKPHNGMMGERTILDPQPYYWGNTNEECQAVCDDYNKRVYGIERAEALEIIASSMRAQNDSHGLFL